MCESNWVMVIVPRPPAILSGNLAKGWVLLAVVWHPSLSLSLPQMILRKAFSGKPKVSAVLTAYLKQCSEPPWTSYVIKVSSKRIQLGLGHNFLTTPRLLCSTKTWTTTNGATHTLTGPWTVGQTITYYGQVRKSLFDSILVLTPDLTFSTGCYPYMKYHCTKRPIQNLSLEDNFFKFIKVINLGIPPFFYGLAARFLIRHMEYVEMPDRKVPIYLLYAEDKGSQF